MTTDEQNRRFEAWLEQHAAVLHHVANGFAEQGDRSDLMQELLLAVWRAVPAFRGGAQSSTFVYRVAHNAALTWRRSQRTYEQQLARFETMAAADPTSPHPGPVGTDRAPEALEHVYAAIRRLPPVDRSLILLHLDGVSYAGIAEIHGLSETNVGARLTRLKQKLTATLETIAHELR